MSFKNYKELEKSLVSNTLDQQSCIDFFTNYSITQKRSHIAFSSTMVVNFFRYKHSYIFKYLFEKGILYSTYIDQNVIQKLSKQHLKSEDFVYATNFPKFLFFKNEHNYNQYTNEQKKIFSYIDNVYYKIKHLKSDHPYSMFYFFKPNKEHPIHINFEELSSNEFIKKLHYSLHKIEYIKQYFFHFHTHYSVNLINDFFHFLDKHNLLDFTKIYSKLLFNKHYYNYVVKNKISINFFDFNSDFIKNTKLPYIVAQNIISLLDTSSKNFHYFKKTCDYLYCYSVQTLSKNHENYQIYKNILPLFFITHKQYFIELFDITNNFPEKNTVKQIFIDLYENQEFRELFKKYQDKINIKNTEISDFIYTYTNIKDF